MGTFKNNILCYLQIVETGRAENTFSAISMMVLQILMFSFVKSHAKGQIAYQALNVTSSLAYCLDLLHQYSLTISKTLKPIAMY